MAILDIDGFDAFGTEANLKKKWTVNQFSGSHTVFETGRFGTGEALTSDHTYWQSISRTIDNTQTVFIGTACYFNYAIDSLVVFRFYDGGDDQCEVVVDLATHLLVVYRNGVFLGASVKTIPFEKWVYIECKATIKQSIAAGDFTVRVNGEQVLSLPATTDTARTGNEYLNKVEIGGIYSGFGPVGGIVKYDDFYLTDSIGAAPFNSFLGALRVVTLHPNGNGTTLDFTGSDADSIDNYLHVDEVIPDGDTTYIESSLAGDIDLHAIESLPATPLAIIGVNATAFVRKTDAAATTGKILIRTGGTNYEGAAYTPSDVDYTRFDQAWGLNPDTGVAWVEADITGLEIGSKVES